MPSAQPLRVGIDWPPAGRGGGCCEGALFVYVQITASPAARGIVTVAEPINVEPPMEVKGVRLKPGAAPSVIVYVPGARPVNDWLPLPPDVTIWKEAETPVPVPVKLKVPLPLTAVLTIVIEPCLVLVYVQTTLSPAARVTVTVGELIKVEPPEQLNPVRLKPVVAPSVLVYLPGSTPVSGCVPLPPDVMIWKEAETPVPVPV